LLIARLVFQTGGKRKKGSNSYNTTRTVYIRRRADAGGGRKKNLRKIRQMRKKENTSKWTRRSISVMRFGRKKRRAKLKKRELSKTRESSKGSGNTFWDDVSKNRTLTSGRRGRGEGVQREKRKRKGFDRKGH